jgi:flagellar assembly protein FliH
MKIKTKHKVIGAQIRPYGEIDPQSVRIPDMQEIIDKNVESAIMQYQQQFQIQLQEEAQKAYQQGLMDGKNQTVQKLGNDLQRSIQAIQKVALTLKGELHNIYQNEEQELLKLSLAIARKIVDNEIETNPELVLTVVKNSLNLMNERKKAKILVNAQDWTLVKNNISNLNIKTELPEDLEIVSSTAVKPGGCRVESPGGSIDADIETQFDEIKRRLLKQ